MFIIDYRVQWLKDIHVHYIVDVIILFWTPVATALVSEQCCSNSVVSGQWSWQNFAHEVQQDVVIVHYS